MNNILISQSYKETFENLKSRIYEAQYKAFTAANKELIDLYWDIGKMIVEKQEREKWGDSIVDNIARDLQVEFEGIKGFSRANIFRMRSFYLTYRDYEIVAPLVRQLTWTNNILIFEKCKDEKEREFYIRTSINKGWSKRTLTEMINNQEYERWAIQQNNFKDTLPVDLATKGELLVKDHYNLDFLMLEKEHKERHLEEAIVKNIIKFLAEMGGNFAFIGKQYPVTVNENEFFIDLLFYHRKLKCLVAIELKTDEFKTEYASKMALYLAALDKHEKDPNENPSIGIIVCRDKDRDLVDLTLSFITKPVGVATYTTYKSKEKLPAEISKYMPTVEEIKKRLLSISS